MYKPYQCLPVVTTEWSSSIFNRGFSLITETHLYLPVTDGQITLKVMFTTVVQQHLISVEILVFVESTTVLPIKDSHFTVIGLLLLAMHVKVKRLPTG